MPLILLTFIRFLNTGKVIYWPVFIVFSALSVLAGHPPTIIYTGILVVSYWIYDVISSRRAFGLKEAVDTAVFSLVSCASIIMLTMPQAGMFLELLGRSTRGQGFEYSIASDTSMAYTHLWAFLMPAGIHGFSSNFLNEWLLYSMGLMNFFSVTAVFLVTMSFFYPKSRLYMWSFILACVALLMALGKNTPVHSWFFTFFPFFSMLRHPGFAMTLFVIPVCVMAAFTLDHVRRLTPAQIPFIGRISYLQGISRRAMRAIFYMGIVLAFIVVLLVMNRGTVMKNYGLGPKTFASFILGLISFLAIFYANFLLYYLKDKGRISPDFYFGVVIFMIFFELACFASGVNPVMEDVIYRPGELKLGTPEILRSTNYKFVHTDEAASLNITNGASPYYAELKFLSTVPSNTGTIYGLNDAGGYNPVESKNYTDYLHGVISGDSILDAEKLDILNIKYVVSVGDIKQPDFELEYDGDFKIWKNPRALPLFFTTKDKDRLDLIVGQYSWSRRKELDYTLYKVGVNVENPGYFVFSNNYYPGWNVYVDNKTAVIEKIFGIYMGVRVEKGPHDITFWYSPTNFREYSALYAVMALMMLFLGAGYIILASRKAPKKA